MYHVQVVLLGPPEKARAVAGEYDAFGVIGELGDDRDLVALLSKTDGEVVYPCLCGANLRRIVLGEKQYPHQLVVKELEEGLISKCTFAIPRVA